MIKNGYNMTIEELKRELFIDSEEVCGSTMVDTFEAQELCDNAFNIGYNKAIDDFADKMIIMMPGHKQDILQIAEILKENGKNERSI